MPGNFARPRRWWIAARQVALQIHRWLPGRYIVLVGDTAFAAIEFLAAVRGYVSVVTRLRLDAGLYVSSTGARTSSSGSTRMVARLPNRVPIASAMSSRQTPPSRTSGTTGTRGCSACR